MELDKKLAWGGHCEESEGTVAALLGESIFHDMFTADDDGIPNDYVCTEIEDDRLKDVSRGLEARIKEAEKEGSPGEKVKGLKEIIQKHWSVFRICLDAQGQVDRT